MGRDQWLRRLFLILPRPTELGRLRRMLWLSLVIGVPTGLVAAGFAYSIHACSHFFEQFLCHYTQPLPAGEGGAGVLPANPDVRRWLLFFLPALGGLLSGFLVYRFAPEAEGHGTDQVINAFHNARGRIRTRVPIVKIIASAITIGSGGSAGREGPVAQVGAGVASYLAGLLRLSDRERRLLVVTGVAAGIGSIFQAPLGGALFAVEVLYRAPEFEFEAIIPSFIASIVAYTMYSVVSGYGWSTIFASGAYGFHNPLLLLFYLALAVLLFLFGRLYVEGFYLVRDRCFRPLPIPNVFKPALGGLLLGCTALLFSLLVSRQHMGAVYGTGYGYLQLAIDGRLGIAFMLTLALFRIVATAFTIGSGGSGGVFGPSVLIGGMVGGAFGQVCHLYFPHLISAGHASAFVLVGMAGFFAGVANVPVSAMLMVSEMTTGYGLLVPLMLVTAVVYSVSPKSRSIYETQVYARADSPAHMGEFVTGVLRRFIVRDVLQERRIETIRENMSLRELAARIGDSSQECFPVVDGQGRLTGVLLPGDVRVAAFDRDLDDLLIARDLVTTQFVKLVDTDPLDQALRKFVETEQAELPVVAAGDEGRIVGLLNRHDLIVAYNRQMQRQLTPDSRPEGGADEWL